MMSVTINSIGKPIHYIVMSRVIHHKFHEDHPYGHNYDIKKDIMFTSEMKYNRMVLYEGRHTHGAILNRSMFKEYPRLAQVFFM